jgi:hypothetical protein
MSSFQYRTLGTPVPSLSSLDQFNSFDSYAGVGNAYLSTELSAKIPKVEVSEYSSGSNLVNMNIYPEDIEGGLDKTIKMGDMVFNIVENRYKEHSLTGSAKIVNFPSLQYLLKTGYHACKSDLKARIGAVLKSSIGDPSKPQRIVAVNQQVSNGFRQRTIGSDSSDLRNAKDQNKANKEKALLDAHVNKFYSMLQTTNEIFCDYEELERFCYERDPERDTEFKFVCEDYEKYMAQKYQAYKSFIDELDHANEEEEQFAKKMRSTDHIKYNAIRKSMSEGLKVVLDEAFVSNSPSKCIALYDLKEVFDKSMRYLTPSLVFNMVKYLGVVSSEFNLNETTVGSWKYNHYNRTYGVATFGGPVTMFQYMDHKFKGHEKIFLTLQRHLDVKRGTYDYVMPVFRVGLSAEIAFERAAPFNETYISHVDGKIKSRKYEPSYSRNTWCIGTYKDAVTSTECAASTFKTAQMKDDETTIKMALEARKDLPMITVYVKQNF